MEQAAETAKNVLNLSDSDTAKIKSFGNFAGQVIFMTENHRIHAKFMLTSQEKEMFDTTPME